MKDFPEERITIEEAILLPHVAKPVIKNCLDKIAEEAINFLSPHFGLSAVQVPLTRLGTRSHYVLPTGGLAGYVGFSLREIWDPAVVGEEYGHYLHSLRKPELHRHYGADASVTNLVEMVGYYAGLVYASERHPELNAAYPIFTGAQQTALQSPVVLLILEDRPHPSEIIESRRNHYGGMRAALYLYQRHGRALLRDLSSMDVPEVLELLRANGFRKRLAVQNVSRANHRQLLIEGQATRVVDLARNNDAFLPSEDR